MGDGEVCCDDGQGERNRERPEPVVRGARGREVHLQPAAEGHHGERGDCEGAAAAGDMMSSRFGGGEINTGLATWPAQDVKRSQGVPFEGDVQINCEMLFFVRTLLLNSCNDNL